MYILVARDPTGRVVASAKVTDEPQTIGRSPACAVVLPSSGVSREHASFYLDEGGVVISDEGSANGVKVDGQLISAPTLVDHTNSLQISSFVISLESEEQRNLSPARPEAAGDTDEELIEHDTRLEAHTGAAGALASSTLELVGRGGAYDGTRFPLESLLMTVGRVEANDLVLDDPSVSRRHAQVRLSVTGDRVTLLDLRSHNGTYLGGQRVKRADAAVGDVIRFGDLAFKIERRRGAQVRRVGRNRPRRRLFLALGLLVVLLGTVAVVAYRNRVEPVDRPERAAIDVLQERQARVQVMVERARRKVELRQWSAAIAELRKVIDADPLNSEAGRLKQQATDELGHQRTFQEGLKYYALGNRENLVKARKIFERIPKSSFYRREVRYRLNAIDQKVAQGYRVEGVSRCRAHYWRQCQAALCEFFELLPGETPIPGEPGLRRLLQGAERRLRRQRGFEPCKAPRYLSPPRSMAQGADLDELLEHRYPDVEPVHQVLKLYLGGNVDGALHGLNKLRSSRAMRPHTAMLSEINRQLLVIRGKYQEGYSAYRERNVEEADRQWSLLLAAEKGLLPAGIESFHHREVRRMLGDLYFELGEEQFKSNRYGIAARNWHRGHEVNQKHDRLLDGLLQLEKTAEQLIAEGRQHAADGRQHDARTKLTLARDICRAGSTTRKKAEEALANLGR